jgi:hypothetical protein
MPVRFEIDALNRRVWATAEGLVSSAELQSFLGDVIAAQAMSYCKLFDISQGQLEDPANLMEVAATVRLYEQMIGKSGPMAVVDRKGMKPVYMDKFVADADADRRTRFFTDRHAALGWLTEQESGGPVPGL